MVLCCDDCGIGSFGFVVFLSVFAVTRTRGLVGLVVIVVVDMMVASITVSLYATRYTLTQSELILRASIFIGGTKRLFLDTVESAERTLIPFGIRLFGASGYGGYCYFPSLGRAFVVITNFRDGVLIRAKKGIYLITPRNPDEFIESIKNARARL